MGSLRTPDVVKSGYLEEWSASVSCPRNESLIVAGVTEGRYSGLKKKYQRPKMNTNLQAITTTISRRSLEFRYFLRFGFIFSLQTVVDNFNTSP